MVSRHAGRLLQLVDGTVVDGVGGGTPKYERWASLKLLLLVLLLRQPCGSSIGNLTTGAEVSCLWFALQPTNPGTVRKRWYHQHLH